MDLTSEKRDVYEAASMNARLEKGSRPSPLEKERARARPSIRKRHAVEELKEVGENRWNRAQTEPTRRPTA